MIVTTFKWIATACICILTPAELVTALPTETIPLDIDSQLEEFRNFLPQAQTFIEDLDGRVLLLENIFSPQTELKRVGSVSPVRGYIALKNRIKLRLFLSPHMTAQILSLPQFLQKLDEVLVFDKIQAQQYKQKLLIFKTEFETFVKTNQSEIETTTHLHRWLLVNKYILYSEISLANVTQFLAYTDFLDQLMPQLIRRAQTVHAQLQDLRMRDPILMQFAEGATHIPVWVSSLVTLGSTGGGIYSLMTLPFLKGVLVAAGFTAVINYLFYQLQPLIEDYSEDKAARLSQLRSQLLENFNSQYLLAYQDLQALLAKRADVKRCRKLLESKI